jgi:hypothetical protein
LISEETVRAVLASITQEKGAPAPSGDPDAAARHTLRRAELTRREETLNNLLKYIPVGGLFRQNVTLAGLRTSALAQNPPDQENIKRIAAQTIDANRAELAALADCPDTDALKPFIGGASKNDRIAAINAMLPTYQQEQTDPLVTLRQNELVEWRKNQGEVAIRREYTAINPSQREVTAKAAGSDLQQTVTEYTVSSRAALPYTNLRLAFMDGQWRQRTNPNDDFHELSATPGYIRTAGRHGTILDQLQALNNLQSRSA